MKGSPQANHIEEEHFLNALQQKVNALLNDNILQAAYISKLEKRLTELEAKDNE